MLPHTGLTGRDDAILASRLMTPAFAGDGSRKASIILVGTDFVKEKELFAIDGKFVAGGYDGKGAVIGKKLASILNLGVGDEIRLQATTADGATNLDYWKVSGIYSTGYPPLDRGLAFVDLAQAQSFLGAEGSVNKVYCRVTGGKNAVARDRGVAALVAGNAEFARLGLTFRNWQEYAKGIVEDAKKDGAFYAIFIVILVFLSFSTMAGTMRVTVFERKREIGMLRASGWLQSEVATQFLLEAFIIGIAGSAAGCLAGGVLSFALQLHPIAFGETFANLDIPAFALTCDLQPVDFVRASLAGVLTAAFAGFAPALNGARMPILESLSERQG
jgi:lipoprotein-releasing system permease protein